MKLRRKTAPKQRQRQRSSTNGPDTIRRSATFSYGASRPDQESTTNRESERVDRLASSKRAGRFWLQRAGLLVLLLAVTASVTSALTLSVDPEIVAVDEKDNASAFLHSQADYQRAASEILAGSFLNRNKITINTNGVSQQLVKRFPELSDASITLPLLAHRPLVHIQAAKPALVLSTTSGSYILDETGVALLPSGSLISSVRDGLPQVTDQSGLTVSLGHQILTRNNVTFIETVVAQLAAKQVKATTLTLPSATSELDAQIDGKPYFVKFNLHTPDARRQAGAFLATKAQLERSNITPSKYIDVRVEGRAYYQ